MPPTVYVSFTLNRLFMSTWKHWPIIKTSITF